MMIAALKPLLRGSRVVWGIRSSNLDAARHDWLSSVMSRVNRALAGRADLIICNSHAVDTAHRLHLPLYRAGFPQYDLIGGYQRLWVGYRGTRQTLFDLANLLLTHGHHEMAAYRSIYAHAPSETPPRH